MKSGNHIINKVIKRPHAVVDIQYRSRGYVAISKKMKLPATHALNTFNSGHNFMNNRDIGNYKPG